MLAFVATCVRLAPHKSCAAALLTVLRCSGHSTISASLRLCLRQAILKKQSWEVASDRSIYSSAGYTTGIRLAPRPVPHPPPPKCCNAASDEGCQTLLQNAESPGVGLACNYNRPVRAWLGNLGIMHLLLPPSPSPAGVF